MQNFKKFRQLNACPIKIQLSSEVTVNELITNRASWHKSCQLKFSSSRLKRILEKSKEKDNSYSSKEPKRKRSSICKEVKLSHIFLSNYHN